MPLPPVMPAKGRELLGGHGWESDTGSLMLQTDHTETGCEMHYGAERFVRA